MRGSEFFAALRDVPRGAPREMAILQAVASGAARAWPYYEVPLLDNRGAFFAAGDMFSIGADDDFVRVPLAGPTAQLIADAFGALLPTPRMSDLIWRAAHVKLAPQAMDAAADSGKAMLGIPFFEQHNAMIEQQRAGRIGLVAGHKKDVALMNFLLTKPTPRVGIYGWHQLSGIPIQGMGTTHELEWYSDYSHGARFIAPRMRLDGAEVAVLDVLRNASTASLLSHEGVLQFLRYDTSGLSGFRPAGDVVVEPGGPAPEPQEPPPGIMTPLPYQPPMDAIDQWARKVLLAVWPRVLPGEAPTATELQAVQAVGRFEGFYGWADRPAVWKGTQNWGACQCGHGPPCGNDCFETTDSHGDGTKYQGCFKRYPTPEDGAADLLRILTKKWPSVRAAMRTGDLDALATEMRRKGYFEAKAELYASKLFEHAQKIAQRLGEPLVVRRAGMSPVQPGTQPGTPSMPPVGGGYAAPEPTSRRGVLIVGGTALALGLMLLKKRARR